MVADTIASDMSTTRPTFLAIAGSLASGAHVVESGESLWKIARQILTERGELASGSSISDLWHSIYELNRALIGDNPNLIHPGQVLQLPTG
ncbi:MAG: LysM peptidoglycan-binding domain-containing protein [Acidobacteria bacterium]|nr:MAG: LysM peptidoglycan-binding domain-containing protein [Acidobacteriota bacterium]